MAGLNTQLGEVSEAGELLGVAEGRNQHQGGGDGSQGGSCERRQSDERSATTDGTWDYNLYLLSPRGCH